MPYVYVFFQVDLARNHWYDYIFTQIARPPRWFSYQNFLPYIKMELPPDLHDNSGWLGFTVYALYTIEKQGLLSVTNRIQQIQHFCFAFLVFQLVMKFLLYLTRPFPSLETLLMSHHNDFWYFTYHACFLE